MNVHVLEPIHAKAMAALRAQAGIEVVDWENPSVRDLSLADGIIVRAAKVDRRAMESAPRLRVIGKHGVGVDAIDLAAARELGKIVTFTPQANMEGVAELAVAFLLTMARNIVWGNMQLRAGNIASIAPKELTGLELKEKTLGLVGLGRIGRRVGEILQKGFSMRVIGFDPFLPEEKFAALGMERAATIEELLPRADCISISVPLTPETTNLLDAGRLALCKPEAILVNTARGGIVDEAALYEALRSGSLRAAASDVFVEEPVSKDHPLLSLRNFAAMPHIGATTEESLIRMGETVVADVARVLRGEEPLYPVAG